MACVWYILSCLHSLDFLAFADMNFPLKCSINYRTPSGSIVPLSVTLKLLNTKDTLVFIVLEIDFLVPTHRGSLWSKLSSARLDDRGYRSSLAIFFSSKCGGRKRYHGVS